MTLSDVISGSRAPNLSTYEYDHYRMYPATNTKAWHSQFQSRVNLLSLDKEVRLIPSERMGGQALVAVKISSWDTDHFGFAMASLQVLFHTGDLADLENCLNIAYDHLQTFGVRFVSLRLHGDDIAPIHLLEDHGFRYFETIVWPVLPCSSWTPDYGSFGVREMVDGDLKKVIEIATNSQFRRGHYYCDAGFPRDRVDALYGKWIQSAWDQRRPIIVIENKGEVAGYFLLELPDTLSKTLGFCYGGMRSLGLDQNARGQRLGVRLFNGAISYLRSKGAEFIDSSYAAKNHISAKLHSNVGFYSVYEEITLHHWLDR